MRLAKQLRMSVAAFLNLKTFQRHFLYHPPTLFPAQNVYMCAPIHIFGLRKEQDSEISSKYRRANNLVFVFFFGKITSPVFLHEEDKFFGPNIQSNLQRRAEQSILDADLVVIESQVWVVT